jgi:hypothetical protein
MRKPTRNLYRFTNPPQVLLHARLDNIAIVPASMLPFKQALQELINNLPQGAVFLCHSQENTRQRKLLERVGQSFKQLGHAVEHISTGQLNMKA